MKTISLSTETGNISIIEKDKPRIVKGPQNVDQVLIKAIVLGVSGIETREEYKKRVIGNSSSKQIIIGNEMIGSVVEMGPQVTGLSIDDLVMPTVRRGCGQCMQCARGNSDLCLSEKYKDCGINGKDGFMAEYTLERMGNLVSIPNEIEEIAILLSPLSLAEKAIIATCSLNHRYDLPHPFPEHAYHYEDWGEGKLGIVFGSSDIAVMSALLLKIKGARTLLISDKSKNSYLGKIIKLFGIEYLQENEVETKRMKKDLKNIDIIIDATRKTRIDTDIINWMTSGTVLCITSPMEKLTGRLNSNTYFINDYINKYQLIYGTISANIRHYEQGIKDLIKMNDIYKGDLKKIITHKFTINNYKKAFLKKESSNIKTIITL